MERTLPTISIGMPVRNAEKYIVAALDSLVSQSFKDFELIISDNASTDDTPSICRNYALNDARIQFIEQPSNIGAINNFKFVLDRAAGEYFAWAAGDDVWEKEWFETLLRYIRQHGCESAFGQVHHIDEYGNAVKHVATGRIFSYCGNVHVRRLKFFLEFEGTGKANLFYALFPRRKISAIPLLDYSHDYHAIHGYLGIQGICGVKGVRLHKRIHDQAESAPRGQRSILAKVFHRLFLPVDIDFLKGYFRNSSVGERIVLCLSMPLKYAIAYKFMLMRFVDAIHTLKK